MLVEGESVQSPWEIVWKCLALIVWPHHSLLGAYLRKMKNYIHTNLDTTVYDKSIIIAKL
jgi:hypothetical protein